MILDILISFGSKPEGAIKRNIGVVECKGTVRPSVSTEFCSTKCHDRRDYDVTRVVMVEFFIKLAETNFRMKINISHEFIS